MPIFVALGPLSVTGLDAQSQALAPGKRRDLLAVLLRRRNAWVSVEELAEALWDRAAYPSSISGSIKTYVHQLRKVLPPEAAGERLAGRRGAYRLTVNPGELDIDLFVSLVEQGVKARTEKRPEEAVTIQRRALTLWQGTPDEDVVDVVAAQHLQEVRLTARYCLADALLERGETTEAIIVLRAVLSEDPLREPAWERLLLAQQAAGWQVDALANYEQARLVLLENFGAEPGTRLQDIYRTLLSQTADAPAPTVKNSVSPSAASGPRVRLRLSLAAVLVVLLFVVTG